MSAEYEAEVLKTANEALVGVKVSKIRYSTPEECEESGWDDRGIVIEFSNGHSFGIMRDDEGNGPGAVATTFDGAAGILAVLPLVN